MSRTVMTWWSTTCRCRGNGTRRGVSFRCTQRLLVLPLQRRDALPARDAPSRRPLGRDVPRPIDAWTMILVCVMAACGFAIRPAQAGRGPLQRHRNESSPCLSSSPCSPPPGSPSSAPSPTTRVASCSSAPSLSAGPRSHCSESKRRVTRFALAGIMAGFACGSKLTAVPEILVAIFALSLLFLVVARRRRSGSRVFPVRSSSASPPSYASHRGSSEIGPGREIQFSPSFLRCWERVHFSDVQVERWRRAHSSQPAQHSVAGRHQTRMDRCTGKLAVRVFCPHGIAVDCSQAERARRRGFWARCYSC